MEAGYCVYGLANFPVLQHLPTGEIICSFLPVCAIHICHLAPLPALLCASPYPEPVFSQLLYITFLAEFFSDDEGLDMDMMYYSEMKDAGYC